MTQGRTTEMTYKNQYFDKITYYTGIHWFTNPLIWIGTESV